MSSNDNSMQQRTYFARTVSFGFALLFAVAIMFTLNSGTVDATKGKTAAASAKLPVVTSVTPNRDVAIGQTLTLTGKNFIKGNNALVVIFHRDGSSRRFATRANGVSTKKATVKVPDVSSDIVRALQTGGAGPLDNQYHLRVITKIGASKSWTNKLISPTVSEDSAASVPVDKGPNGDCDNDGVINSIDTDDDNDLLPDTIETSIGTDPCNQDTDSDDVSDYYEYRVAYELNGGPTLPYPGLRPYPNPLVADSGFDFDGDGLTVHGEFKAWMYTGRMDRFYSDAEQDSDGDGILDGAEDEDHDLLPNLAELGAFQTGAINGGGGELNWLKTDTDGDGLCDGLDDQDHDGPPTPLDKADCTTMVPNNGPSGSPPTLIGAGDPDPNMIDGDDNMYSNFYEWQKAGAAFDSAGDAYNPCKPSVYPVSPYCPGPWNPAPWGP